MLIFAVMPISIFMSRSTTCSALWLSRSWHILLLLSNHFLMNYVCFILKKLEQYARATPTEIQCNSRTIDRWKRRRLECIPIPPMFNKVCTYIMSGIFASVACHVLFLADIVADVFRRVVYYSVFRVNGSFGMRFEVTWYYLTTNNEEMKYFITSHLLYPLFADN